MIIFLAILYKVNSSCSKDEYEAVNEKTTFSLPKLPYEYNSLQPQYWNQLLYYHHDYIHEGLVEGLNNITAWNITYQSQTVTQLLITYGTSDYSLWRYAGGHYSHCLLWWSLFNYQCAQASPGGVLGLAIQDQWGSFDSFQSAFNTAAKGLYGSGWVWLCVDGNKTLVIRSKAEEYSPLAEGYYPFLGLDMWEHSYYLYYQWDSSSYIDAWWSIIDWALIEYFYEEYSSNLIPISI
jgi:superoxide dismutase, Fe-Mn family